MAMFVARPSRVRRWLYPAILCGGFLTGCSGGGTGSASGGDSGTDTPAGAATDVVIGLAWAPSNDPVSGYIIYYGPTQEATDTRAVQLSVETVGSDAPSYSFNAGIDLGLSHGDSVCFRLSSYKGADESDLSEPACAAL